MLDEDDAGEQQAAGAGGGGATTPLHGAETIWRDGACVGIVRSTAYGHTIGRTIAYGYVSLDHLPSSGDGADGVGGAAGGGGARTDAPAKITNKWLSAGRYEVGDRGRRLPATLHLKASGMCCFLRLSSCRRHVRSGQPVTKCAISPPQGDRVD